MEMERIFSVVRIQGWKLLSQINWQHSKSFSVLLVLYPVMLVVTETYTQDKVAKNNVHTLVTVCQN